VSAVAPPPATSVPARPPTQPTAPGVTDQRPAIHALVDRYARAIESRSVNAITQLYPAITAAQQHDWEEFFSTVRDVKVQLTITRLEITGPSAGAQIQGRYQYANTSTRRMEQQPVAFHASLERAADGWRVRSIP
jgi:hypothetical protein